MSLLQQSVSATDQLLKKLFNLLWMLLFQRTRCGYNLHLGWNIGVRLWKGELYLYIYYSHTRYLKHGLSCIINGDVISVSAYQQLLRLLTHHLLELVF